MNQLGENISRRVMLAKASCGFGYLALSALLGESARAANNAIELAPKTPPLPARAKRVIHVVLMGGLSHIDSFDYKPELEKFHGKPLQYKERPATFFNKIGLIRKNDWAFR